MRGKRFLQPFAETRGRRFVHGAQFLYDPVDRALCIAIRRMRLGALDLAPPFQLVLFRKITYDVLAFVPLVALHRIVAEHVAGRQNRVRSRVFPSPDFIFGLQSVAGGK